MGVRISCSCWPGNSLFAGWRLGGLFGNLQFLLGSLALVMSRYPHTRPNIFPVDSLGSEWRSKTRIFKLNQSSVFTLASADDPGFWR